jgi:hypothetical protein
VPRSHEEFHPLWDAYELLEPELLRLRLAADRFVPLRPDDDEVLFRAGDFFALVLVDGFRAEGFLAVDRVADFLAVPFRAEVFLRVDFLAGDFLAGDFLPGDFLPGDFLLNDRLLDDFLFFRRRSRASAVAPIAVPSAAALVAASNGFSMTAPTAFLAPEPTVLAPDSTFFAPEPPTFLASEPSFWAPEPTFFAPDPNADAVPPAFSFTIDIVDPPICSVCSIAEEKLRLGGLRPATFAAFSLTVPETSLALSCAISCIASAIVPTTSCAASVASSFLLACVTDSVSFLRSGMGLPPEK